MNVLILQLKRIGDLILTTPVLRMLREMKPDAKITIVTMEECSPLLDAIAADRKLVFNRPFGGTKFWRDLLSQSYDVCLDFTGNDRSALLAALSKARRRITYRRFQKRFLRRFIYTEFINSSVTDRHTVDHHLDLLYPLGCQAQGLPPSLSIPEAARHRISRWLEAQRIPTPFAVVHPGTARAEKYWLPERWNEVIQHLNKSGYYVLMTGTLDPKEQAHRDAIAKGWTGTHEPNTREQSETASNPSSAHLPPSASFMDCLGTFSLIELAALLEKASLLCSVDSAPVHLADAARTPVVALFGPTNPFHWRPRSSHATIVRPEGLDRISPAEKGGPMAAIPTRVVLEAIDHVTTLKPM